MPLSDAELTKRAAELMGWHETESSRIKWWTSPSGSGISQHGFQPLWDWGSAGTIVEKMRADGWYLHVESGPKMIDSRWVRVVQVRWGKNKQFGVFTSLEFPRAITIAALLAVGAITEADLS